MAYECSTIEREAVVRKSIEDERKELSDGLK